MTPGGPNLMRIESTTTLIRSEAQILSQKAILSHFYPKNDQKITFWHFFKKNHKNVYEFLILPLQ